MLYDELFDKIKTETDEIDKISLLIDNMKRQSHSMEYEEAEYILSRIKDELTKKKQNLILFIKFIK